MEEKKELTGKFYDMQGFSVHDGPGIRLTLFMKGCPLSCLWCHSPESQAFPTELNWMEIKCVGIEKCGNCLNVCPHDCIKPGHKKLDLQSNTEVTVVDTDRTNCDNCGKCAEACTSKALYMCGTDYTLEEVMQRIHRDVPFFKRSGGGVTVSGGECLCQPDFLLEILKACKAEDIHTAVDTTGFAPWSSIEKVLPYTDIFLYDLKNMDSRLHKLATGIPNELILENAQKIAKAGGKFQIRIPIIPLFNDSKEAFEEFGKFIVSLGDAVEVVQLLPYHKMGTVKWERLQKHNKVFEAVPPKDELVQERKAYLESLGLNVMIH